MEARYGVCLWISISVCIAKHGNKLLSIASIKFQRFRPQPSSGGALTAKVKNSKLTTLKSSFVSLQSFCKAIYLRKIPAGCWENTNEARSGTERHQSFKFGGFSLKPPWTLGAYDINNNKYLFQYPLWQASDLWNKEAISHMTLFPQRIVFKGCMAWSSWSGGCKECGQKRQRVGKWQDEI